MSDIFYNQCKKLYMDAFHDDAEFTDLLFKLFYDSSCKYLCVDGNVVSMLFAIDVTLDSFKGKYIYAVATDERYRGKGYMRSLFEDIFHEYKTQYDFFCLKPMDDSLFDFYEKLGFVKCFKKSTVIIKDSSYFFKLKDLTDINEIKRVRKYFLGQNYVEYSDLFFKLLLSYCEMLTDDKDNPTVFAVREKQSSKIKEILGDYNHLPKDFSNVPLLIPGIDSDFAMVKFLNDNRFENKYLGFALD